ncbi:hypothetical protein PG993_012517 [Apiospora rasikravindrae]|uniref:Rhodopsin domain-containing protein n=1 Tax=Apiospora rasikravindrae TaxID=990691 RepID=A0ABR1S2S2_9PEZI
MSDPGAGTTTFPPPVNPNDPGIGPLMIGFMWTFTSLAMIAIALRLYVRVFIVEKLGLDDWFMIVAGIFQLAYQACMTKAYQWGLGMDSMNLTYDPQITNILKWNLIGSIPGIVVAICARISIATLLIRLFGGRKWFKWYLIVFTTLQSATAAATEMLYCLQTDPIEGFWNPMIPARRLDPMIAKVLWMTGQTLFTVADLSYVILPVSFIWKLKMPLHRKIPLMALICMSIFTAVASIMRTILVQEAVGQAEAMQGVARMFLWANLETTFTIIMGCLPILPKLFQQERFNFVIIKSYVQTVFNRTIRSFHQGTRRSQQAQDAKHNGYHGLESVKTDKHHMAALAPDSPPHKPALGPNTTCSSREPNFSDAAGDITRTDQFMVSYEGAPTRSDGPGIGR